MTPQVDGRTIDELIVLHELEPSLQEVITEGRTDAGVVAWFLDRHGIDVPVYAISDRIQIDDDKVVAYGYEVGNKGRLITASYSIAASVQASTSITLIIDADYYYAFADEIPDFPHLLITDYSSVELYCYNSKTLGKFLKIALRAPVDLDPASVLDRITESLRSLFLIRWILHTSSDSLGIISKIERRCKLTPSGVQVDIESLLRDSVNRAASSATDKASLIKDMMAKHNALQKELDLDSRRCINGHDFPRILCFYLTREYSQLFREDRKGFKSVDTLANSLLSCIDEPDLRAAPMFATLLARVSSSLN